MTLSPSHGSSRRLAPVGDQAAAHADALADRLGERGLQAFAVRAEDRLARGAIAVRAHRTDAEAGCVVVLLPTPQSGDLQWHWARPLLGYHDFGYRWYQSFCPAADYDRAESAVVSALARRVHVPVVPEQQLLARVGHPLHALTWRMLETLAETQRMVEDPALLRRLFQLDHLAMRKLRLLERLAVLSGATARKLPEPLPLPTVLRQAAAHIEHYKRVRIPPTDIEVDLAPEAAPAIMLLLAELLENATRWSSPTTGDVLLTVARTVSGVRVEITDQGLAIQPEKLTALRRMLADPDTVNISEQITAGPIGLLVVARLAARHHMRVGLHPHEGGTRAVVELPETLLRRPQPSTPLGPEPSLAGPAGAPVPSVITGAGVQQRPGHHVGPGIGLAAGPVDGLADGPADGELPPLPRRGAARASAVRAVENAELGSPPRSLPEGRSSIDRVADFLEGVQDQTTQSADRTDDAPRSTT